jgi:large subunit ribosomal protein L29
MKLEEVRELSDKDLQRRIEESRQELFNLRFQIATRKIKNHQRIPEVKKDIARMTTLLRERELMRRFGGEDVEPEAEAVAPAPTRRRGVFGRNKKSRSSN